MSGPANEARRVWKIGSLVFKRLAVYTGQWFSNVYTNRSYGKLRNDNLSNNYFMKQSVLNDEHHFSVSFGGTLRRCDNLSNIRFPVCVVLPVAYLSRSTSEGSRNTTYRTVR